MTVADGLGYLLGTLAIGLTIAVAISLIGYFVSVNLATENLSRYGKEDKGYLGNMIWNKAFRRVLTLSLIFGVITSLGWALIPSKRNMMIIIAGGSIGNFISTDSSSKAIPSELTKYVRNFLKKESGDLDYETKKELGVETPKEKMLNDVKNFTKEQLIDYLKNDTTHIK
jgi:hypothetical protein